MSDAWLKEQLAGIDRASRRRFLAPIDSTAGPYIERNNRRLMNMSSNDYLALAGDSRLKEAACEAVDRWGTGAGASRLMSGSLALHEDLEQAAADLVGMEAALVFSSGYAANTGLLPCLVDKQDVIYSDRLNHASLIDGCRLSRASRVVFRHLDMEDLAARLTDSRDRFKRAFLVTESYFSMDGESAPLGKLAELAERFNVHLIVDEAHSLGVFGKGRGACVDQAVTDRVFAIVGTLGKSLGSQGAFVAGSRILFDFLVNRARTMIFSTALAPPAAAAALAAIRIVREQGNLLTDELSMKTERFRKVMTDQSLPVKTGSIGPIVPLMMGNETAAMAASNALAERGVLAHAIRPPTVPEGECRIRFSVNRGHRVEDLENVVKSLPRHVGIKKKPRLRG